MHKAGLQGKVLVWGVKPVRKLILASICIVACASIMGISMMLGCSSPAANSHKASIDDVLAEAAFQARGASSQGTFGVGGVLMDLDGNIIYEAHNNVICGDRVNDPTAHGERQIIDWYLENKESLSLPAADQLVLVTSLDPCAMCTGAAELAGFKLVVVGAYDDYAGMNYQADAKFVGLVGTEMHDYVLSSFSYPKVVGDSSLARSATGASLDSLGAFSECTLQASTVQECLDAFSETASDVRAKVSASDTDIDEVIDPATLPEDHPIRQYLLETFGRDCLAYRGEPGNPGPDFIEYLEENHPGFDGVAYFDSFGNLLLLEEDSPSIPTQTAFMKATRAYAAARNVDLIDGYDVHDYLSHPKYGYFVYMTCPKDDATGLMEAGAFGSTMEDSTDNPILFITGSQNEQAFSEMIENLPPLYTDAIGVRVQQVADEGTVKAALQMLGRSS